eukprot:6189692-Pleurochrysis_carterae.AAC.2
MLCGAVGHAAALAALHGSSRSLGFAEELTSKKTTSPFEHETRSKQKAERQRHMHSQAHNT